MGKSWIEYPEMRSMKEGGVRRGRHLTAAGDLILGSSDQSYLMALDYIQLAFVCMTN